MNAVCKQERGWAEHFICADSCCFRRNTLITNGTVYIVVSTVGNMRLERDGKTKLCEIGLGRYYETMAFHSDPDDTVFHDADVSREVSFDSKWAIGEVADCTDNEANDMHEAVVFEIMSRVSAGEYTEV